MSWTVHLVGKAVDVNRSLREHSHKFSDTQSREEYESALPHLLGLLELNQSEAATSGQGADEFLVQVRAGGSAWWEDGKRKTSSCYAEIKRLEGTHV